MKKRWIPWLAGAAAFVLLLAWVRCGPLPEDFLEPGRHLSTAVVDRHGVALYESLSKGGTRSKWLGPGDLPETLVAATLAAEDRRFFRHAGVDPLALLRAAWHDLLARRAAEGGSTLTQQAVKQLTGRPRSLRGKLLEVLLALRLEHRLSKREILALYLNLAPYGNQYVGAAAASEGYFGCPPQNLTPAQAAFLAGLPQRPSTFDPYRNTDLALARERAVLARMASLGSISPQDYRQALAERLAIGKRPRSMLAPHFVEKVLSELGERRASRVETTLDAELQADVRGILNTHKREMQTHQAYNAAVVVLLNQTGEWLAWEGSGDYFDEAHGGTIDGVTSLRQPGSALKPFTYALAFERGFTPASVLPDIPSHFPTAEAGILYSPRDYDNVFRGPLRARMALAGSVNVAAVWLLSKIGVPDLLRFLRQVGFTTFDKRADYYGYGLTLGDAEVRLDELVAAYACLARGGVYAAPGTVRRVIWGDGSVWQPPAPEKRRVISERAAYWVTDVLSDPKARAFVFGTGGSLDFPFPAAVKTGTSQAYRDNWTVGYTKEVTVGVWVGNFDRSEMVNSSGVTGAGPIFHEVLIAAQRRIAGGLHSGAPLAPAPPGLSPQPICALSGMAAKDACPARVVERLPADRVPLPCTWHLKPGRTAVAWPPLYRNWAREAGMAVQGGAGPAAQAAAKPARPLQIMNPPGGATYLLDPTLRTEFQTLPLRAEAQAPGGSVTWSVDGVEVGTCPASAALDWPIRRGRHTVAARDAAGNRDSVTILVK